MKQTTPQSLLFEMLRSFTTLAYTLNLSKAVRILGSTRQTIRRHIDTLEAHRNEKLFEVTDRHYHLTDAGTRSLAEAKSILNRGSAWLAGYSSRIDELESVKFEDDNQGISFFSQQHHLNVLWTESSPLLQQGFQCWANANTLIENAEMDPIRPYLIIYRRYNDNWLYTEIGEKSSYSSWFGWKWAKSCVGLSMVETPDKVDRAQFIDKAYLDVYSGNGVRLDHVHTQIPREKDGPLHPVSFQRLLLGCTFPDGSFALASLIDRTYNIKIAGLSDEEIKSMPENLLTNFTL